VDILLQTTLGSLLLLYNSSNFFCNGTEEVALPRVFEQGRFALMRSRSYSSEPMRQHTNHDRDGGRKEGRHKKWLHFPDLPDVQY
jgi:hypothetical protein